MPVLVDELTRGPLELALAAALIGLVLVLAIVWVGLAFRRVWKLAGGQRTPGERRTGRRDRLAGTCKSRRQKNRRWRDRRG